MSLKVHKLLVKFLILDQMIYLKQMHIKLMNFVDNYC